jgi:hypothetical protein
VHLLSTDTNDTNGRYGAQRSLSCVCWAFAYFTVLSWECVPAYLVIYVFFENTLKSTKVVEGCGVNKHVISLLFPFSTNFHWILFYADIKKSFFMSEMWLQSAFYSFLVWTWYETRERRNRGGGGWGGGYSCSVLTECSVEYRTAQLKCNSSTAIHVKVLLKCLM